jgi:RNA polymerase sigma factor (sigma-70 family)
VAYFYGVARNIQREHARSRDRNVSALEVLPAFEHPSEHPADIMQKQMERKTIEQRIECLEKCLSKLPPETRALVVSYYEGEEAAKINNRKRMAEALGISLNSLRTRTHRIREKLEECIIHCTKQILN